MSIDSLVLNAEQQLELSRIAQSRSLPAGYVFRARLILMLAEGASFSTIKAKTGNYGADHHPMEAAFSCFGAGRTGYQPSGTATLGAESEAASPDFVCYAQTAEGWFHSVELPQARRGAGREQGCRPSRLERSWAEAASAGSVYGKR
jgi:hypothetical protein